MSLRRGKCAATFLIGVLVGTSSFNVFADLTPAELDMLDDKVKCEKSVSDAVSKVDQSKGCYNVGVFYHNRGDNEAAREFFKKACDMNLKQGCTQLKKSK